MQSTRTLTMLAPAESGYPRYSVRPAGGSWTSPTNSGVTRRGSTANYYVDLDLAPGLYTIEWEPSADPLDAVAEDFAVGAGLTGDAFARLGAPAGASIAADIATRAPASTALSNATWTDAKAAFLDVSIDSRLATSGYTAPPTPPTASVVASAVRTELAAELGRITGPVALASQIPANFTTATFASAGVFSTNALANAPTGSGGSGGASLNQIQSELDSRAYATATALAAAKADTAAIKVKTDNLPASPAAVGSAMTVSDKTGFKLAADGLDAISVADPGGVASHTSLAKMIVAIWRRKYKKTRRIASSATAGTLVDYADDGTTARSTRAYTRDDNGNQTVEAAS